MNIADIKATITARAGFSVTVKLEGVLATFGKKLENMTTAERRALQGQRARRVAAAAHIVAAHLELDLSEHALDGAVSVEALDGLVTFEMVNGQTDLAAGAAVRRALSAANVAFNRTDGFGLRSGSVTK